MLGRKDYTPEELDRCKATVEQQPAAYRSLVNAVAAASTDDKVNAAIYGFEPIYFSNMIVVLDRFLVHRLRMVTGQDGNPLNEEEIPMRR